MLWAQFQPKNDAEAAGFFVGVMIAGLISGAIPFFTGLAMNQTGLGIAGGVVSAGAGALAGCCLGIPVAVGFTVLIVIVASMSGGGPPRLKHPSIDYDYRDDVAEALPQNDRKRRRPVRRDDERRETEDRRKADDRRKESEDDWRRRSEDEDFFRKRGFRPRRSDDDG